MYSSTKVHEYMSTEYFGPRSDYNILYVITVTLRWAGILLEKCRKTYSGLIGAYPRLVFKHCSDSTADTSATDNVVLPPSLTSGLTCTAPDY